VFFCRVPATSAVLDLVLLQRQPLRVIQCTHVIVCVQVCVHSLCVHVHAYPRAGVCMCSQVHIHVCMCISRVHAYVCTHFTSTQAYEIACTCVCTCVWLCGYMGLNICNRHEIDMKCTITLHCHMQEWAMTTTTHHTMWKAFTKFIVA
jgi:hypothetical protein